MATGLNRHPVRLARVGVVHPEDSALRHLRGHVYGYLLDLLAILACVLLVHRGVWIDILCPIRKPGKSNVFEFNAFIE